MATTLGPWDNVVDLASLAPAIATGIGISPKYDDALALPMTRTELIPTHLIPTMLMMIGKGFTWATVPGLDVFDTTIDLFKWISFLQP